jgi:predicted NUDIX family phosphoesterase
MQQWFSKIDLLVHIGVGRDTYVARSKINCPVARPARFNEEYFSILSGAYVDAEKLLGNIPEATRPKHLKYDSSINLKSFDGVESDGYILAESSKILSGFALDIADKVIDAMLLKGIEKIAVVKKDWLGDNNFDDEMDEPAVQRFALEVFGRELEEENEDYFSGAWRREVEPRVHYVEREAAEKDPSVVQLVSAAYVTNNNHFLVLRRSQHEKRAQLRGKLTLIVSGHVDHEDRGLSYGGKNEIENCLLREMSEELEYFDRPVIRPKFAFRMGDDQMGRRHLAIVYAVSTNSDRVQTTGLPGTGDFESSVMWFSFTELQQKITEFDPWSTRVIERLMVE